MTRTLRGYNRLLIAGLRSSGFDDFAPSFPSMLSNLDMEGTRIGVLAQRAGVTRQAAGQLLREIERCGYVERRSSTHDARATMVFFTARGRRLHARVIELIEEIDGGLASLLQPGGFDRVQAGLATIADHVDSSGALGVGDRTEASS